MDQTRVWQSSASTITSVSWVKGKPNGGGCGHSTRMMTGRQGSTQQYQSFLKLDVDWTGAAKLVSAILTLTTDDGLGLTPLPAATATPTITIKRLTNAFRQGTNVEGHFTAGDATSPAASNVDAVTATPTKEANGITNIDVTAQVLAMAPASVQGGGGATNYGFGIYGPTDKTKQWSGWSFFADVDLRPYLTLTFVLGATKPEVPSNLSPIGAVSAIGAFQGDFSDTRPTDTLGRTLVEVYEGSALVWSFSKVASNVEVYNGRFNVVPDNLTLKRNVDYTWRARYYDQEGQLSDWTAPSTFSVTNTNPDAPTPTPADGTFDSLVGVQFRGGEFSDPDDGDTLLAYQIQLAPYTEGDAHWSDPASLKWDTGKVYVASGTTSFETHYGGGTCDAATYHVRMRVWDNHDGVSDWAYTSLILTESFNAAPASQPSIQTDPHSPWRIRIRDLATKRGPGDVVAQFENAKSVGASIVYNGPGEMHFTLPVDDPQIAVVVPKRVHYGLDFYSGDGWRETFAGLVWDADATETEVVFTCLDYLALTDLTLDERYDPTDPDKAAAKGGSKYVNMTIHDIIVDQLNRAISLDNSYVGFITVGSVDAMNERITIWSTMQPCLSFCVGLINSHRQGTGYRTRLSVERQSDGSYRYVVVDNPGVDRDGLRLAYGELVQGYRVMLFGKNWASLVHNIGRTRDGLKVFYKTASAPGIDPTIWGRAARASIVDNISDENDLNRRVKQAALESGKLGQNVGLAIRSGFLRPRDGWDVCDNFPIKIKHGAVNTDNLGSGYWTCVAVAWEAVDDGSQSVIPTFLPRDDTAAPNAALFDTSPISPQAEWQVGWQPPTTADVVGRLIVAKRYLDQTTGIVYTRDGDAWSPMPVAGSDDAIASTSHGFLAGDAIYFGNLSPQTTGIVEGTSYFVLASGLGADSFQISATVGGAAIVLAEPLMVGVATKLATYAPEVTPDTPSAPVGLTVTPTTVTDSHGTTVGALIIGITPSTDPTLVLTHFEVVAA